MSKIKDLLAICAEEGASDLHITCGRPPTLRVKGRLRALEMPKLTPEDTESLVREVAPKRSWEELSRMGTADFALTFEEGVRFRVSVYVQRGSYGAAFRLIPNRLMTFDEIGLPPSVKKLLHAIRGLILVTGPTGSGKTTTLATMLDYINQNFDRHIVTVEDPIEYYHQHKKSILTQREVGTDVPTFSEAMRRVLRMDPDVILLGEMRDLETISAAITAAETGHLVFGTLHTTGTARTINRIVDAYPAYQQDQIRTMLAVSLLAVVSQVLMPRADGNGQIAGFEVMISTPAIENHIRKNETHKIPSVIQTSKSFGMVMLDDFLTDLHHKGLITRNMMIERAQTPRDLEERTNRH